MDLIRRFLYLAVLTYVVMAMPFAGMGEYADSVWLDYRDGLSNAGDVIMTDIAIEKTAIYTFYAGLVWNNGYMGLQRGGNGFFKHIHFSVWDPAGGGFAELVWSADGVVTQRFGGEGTGWKSMLPFNWKENQIYRLAVRIEYVGNSTDYVGSFFDSEAGEWKDMARFRRTDSRHTFSYVASFVEDFGNTNHLSRSCLLGNGWLRTFSSQWVELRNANFASGGQLTNKDADLVEGLFRLETGGDTRNDTPVGTRLSHPPSSLKPEDIDLGISVDPDVGSTVVQWQTLPWNSYSVRWAVRPDLWPDGQLIPVPGNNYKYAPTNGNGNSGIRFFRISISPKP